MLWKNRVTVDLLICNKHSSLFPFGTKQLIDLGDCHSLSQPWLPPLLLDLPICARTRLIWGVQVKRCAEPTKSKIMAEKEHSKFKAPAYSVSEGKQGKNYFLGPWLPALLNDLLCFALDPGPVLEPTMRYLSPDCNVSPHQSQQCFHHGNSYMQNTVYVMNLTRNSPSSQCNWW